MPLFATRTINVQFDDLLPGFAFSLIVRHAERVRDEALGAVVVDTSRVVDTAVAATQDTDSGRDNNSTQAVAT